MDQNSDHEIRFFKHGDEDDIIELVTSAFDNLNEGLWIWKYLENPNFDKSLVFVAENNGRVIGCMHYLPRELKITRSLTIQGALGADFVVHPDYRGRGIGSSILRFSRQSKVLEKKGMTATFGFIECSRASFYGRNISSVIAPLSTVRYKKFLDASPIEERLRYLNRLTGGEETNICVLFRLTGFPPFTLKIEDGEINVDRGETLQSDIIVEGDPYLLESIYDGSKGIFDLLIGIFKRRIRIRGSAWKIVNFYKIVKTIRKMSREKIEN